MKKYRNSIIILLVTLLSLSVFYVNLVFSSSNLPDFYIKQTNGDAKLSKTLILDANYDENEYLRVTNKGSDYRSELSYFEQLDYWAKNSDTAEMNELIDQYPSFMRGKSYSNLLYNDTNQVIFVDSAYEFSPSKGMHDFRFIIDQLNKKTEDTNSFEVRIPNQEQSGYFDIMDIQVIMDELRVITLNESIDGKTRILHEYIFSLKKEKLIDDNSIIKTEKDTDKQSTYITSLTDINPIQSNPYFMFQLDKSIYDEEQETSQNVSNDLYSYNYKNGKLEKLQIPTNLTEKILQGNEYYLAYDNSSLYASIPIDNDGKKIINMVKYDFENQKVTKDYTISPTEAGTYEHYISIYQNKMILTYRGEDGQPFLKIFNFDNGNSIFEGTIEVKNKDPKFDYEDFLIITVKGL